MLTDLQQIMTDDLLFEEQQLNNPSFTWQSNTYNFVPSITEFQRETETGGLKPVRLLTATIRIYGTTGNVIFTTLPKPQQTIVYTLDGNTYRIETIKQSPEGATFRLIAMSPIKGV